MDHATARSFRWIAEGALADTCDSGFASEHSQIAQLRDRASFFGQALDSLEVLGPDERLSAACSLVADAAGMFRRQADELASVLTVRVAHR